MRSRPQVTDFFDGLVLVEPGVVLTHEWRKDLGGPSNPGRAVGRRGAQALKETP
jgi:hypothetical protein